MRIFMWTAAVVLAYGVWEWSGKSPRYRYVVMVMAERKLTHADSTYIRNHDQK